MNIFRLPSRGFQSYIIPGRLTDILGLIQVLAFHEDRHRSEEGLRHELQGTPRSAKTWTEIAQAHPEFFRVHADEARSISLIVRHVLPPNEAGQYIMPPEFVGRLLNAAVEIYDRQVKLTERWTYLIPIWVALIVGLFSIVGIFVRPFVKLCAR